jgi:hypothetical protein
MTRCRRAREETHAPALVDQGRDAAREYSLAHEGEGHTEVGSVHARPLASAFLASSIQDVVKQMLLAVGAFAFETASASRGMK